MSGEGMDYSMRESPASDVNLTIPRKVYLDSLSVKVLTLAILMFLFGTLLFAWVSYKTITNLHLRAVLEQDGQTATGDITQNSENRGGHLVRYAFLVDGTSYSGEAEMESDDYALPGDRDRLLIRYLPDNPGVNQPAKWQLASFWDVAPFVLLLSLTSFGGFLILRAWRLRTLMRNGIVVVGKVTGCVPKDKLFTVFYEFTTNTNGVAEGRCDLLDEREAGASIPVVYLPNSPKRNNRFPVGGFRVTD